VGINPRINTGRESTSVVCETDYEEPPATHACVRECKPVLSEPCFLAIAINLKQLLEADAGRLPLFDQHAS